MAYSRPDRFAQSGGLPLGKKGAHKNRAKETLKIQGRLARWLIAFGFWLLQIWARTLRYEVDDRAGVVGKPVAENYIAALWHNRLLLISFVLKRFLPQRPGAGLISASRDGDLISDLTRRFGFDVVRGSSSRLGASALRELENVLASGHDVLITPDGPRGPAYELGPGIVFLGAKNRRRGRAAQLGIFQLLESQQLGRFHFAASVCKSACDFRPGASSKGDYHTGGI